MKPETVDDVDEVEMHSRVIVPELRGRIKALEAALRRERELTAVERRRAERAEASASLAWKLVWRR